MIIGLLGHAGSGKDTLADYVVKTRPIVKVALADPMKRICKEVYDFTDLQLWGPSEERNKPDLRYLRQDGTYLTPREALQTLGTEWGRERYDDTWVNMAVRAAHRIACGETYTQMHGFLPRSLKTRIFKTKGSAVVIPDVRFLNEVERIRSAEGIVIKLVSPWAIKLEAGIKGHASEAEQDTIPDSLFDVVLDVPRGIPAFHREIDHTLSTLLATRDRYGNNR